MTKTRIHGRKGGGGSAHTPVESPDDLQSNAKIKILLALSEGEIAGELDGTRILLDGTPVHNPDGSENFTGLKWEVRNGTQTQDYIQGMPDVESETPVNVKLTAANVWTKTFTNIDIDALRIRMGFPALFQQHDNGDMNGSVVEYLIELSTDGGAYHTVVNGVVKGKTTSLYERDHRINLPKAATGWTLRIKRITPDSTSSRLVNNTQIQTYTEIVDAKFRYPNTALLYIEFDAQQFSSVPKITVKPKGKIIRVPANYDPVARTYSGNWDGSFKWAWSNNPAWVFYDIALDKTYGLGNRVTAAEIDKWGLYSIAQYCDEPIDDGMGNGGKEPRFLCDVYIQSQQDAYTVLRDIAAIFRGITYWGNDQLFAYADMPRDVDFVYSRANVVNGEFVYASGSYKNRYSSALVKWGDPTNHYADTVEAAYDNELVKRYGVNQTEITAIGCTRRTEAHRRGRWAILSNAKDRTVSFTVGLDGNIPLPARIIGIADAMLAGKANGGRIHSAQDREVVLDREVEFGKGDRLIVNLPDGTAQARTIASIAADKITVTLTAPFRLQPEAEAVWSIDSDNLAIQQFRVVSVQSNDDGTFAINAVEHDPDKYSFIDNGVRLDAPPITVTPPGAMPAPTNIAISRYDYVSQGINVASMRVQWDAVAGAVAYEAQWRKDNGNWVSVSRTSATGFDVTGIYAGRYQVRVRAINAVEVSSMWATTPEKQLDGKEGKPPMPLSFSATAQLWGIALSWAFPTGAEDTLKTEVQYAISADDQAAMLLSDVPYPQRSYTQTGLKAGQEFWYRARLVDRIGNQGDWTGWIRGQSNANAGDYLDEIGEGFLTDKDGDRLAGDIDTNIDAILQNALANNATVNHQWSQYGEVRADIMVVKTTIAEVDNALAEMSTQVQAQIADVTSVLEDKLTATVDADGATAIHTLKAGVRVNGVYYGAGMSIAVLAQSGQPVVTRISFNANQFVLMSGSNDNQYSPFAVVNGQVFINNAFIQDGTIDSAKIAQQIQSSNFIDGQRGWTINKNGYAQFNNVTVRGAIYADAGEFANGVIGNCRILDSCTIEGKLSAANIEGAVMDGSMISWTGANTNISKILRFGGNNVIPVRVFGQIQITRRGNSGAHGYGGVRQNTTGGLFLPEISISSDIGKPSVSVVYIDIEVGKSEPVFWHLAAGELNQAQAQKTTFLVNIFATPQHTAFGLE
jgi:predicted phage tail protein